MMRSVHCVLGDAGCVEEEAHGAGGRRGANAETSPAGKAAAHAAQVAHWSQKTGGDGLGVHLGDPDVCVHLGWLLAGVGGQFVSTMAVVERMGREAMTSPSR